MRIVFDGTPEEYAMVFGRELPKQDDGMEQGLNMLELDAELSTLREQVRQRDHTIDAMRQGLEDKEAAIARLAAQVRGKTA